MVGAALVVDGLVDEVVEDELVEDELVEDEVAVVGVAIVVMALLLLLPPLLGKTPFLGALLTAKPLAKPTVNRLPLLSLSSSLVA